MIEKLTASVVGMVMIFAAANAVAAPEERDPSGEVADYGLDRDSSRTSSMVREGSLHASVGAFHPDGPAYDVSIDYAINILFMGWQRGTEGMAIDAAYFTPQFMADLRVNGTYVSSKFKVQWLNREDASTMDGNFYPNCDRIRIYDIDVTSGFARLAKKMFQPKRSILEPDANIENLVLVGDIYEGVPVLGAVKIDMTGKYQGINIRAGADYQAP